MSGLVKEKNCVINSPGSSNADTNITIGGVNYQRFTTTGSTRTWSKPLGVTVVYMEAIGGGGAGAAGANASGRGSGAGGGGAFARQSFPAESLPQTLNVVVAAQVTGGVGPSGSGGNPTSDGSDGNDTSITDATASRLILRAAGGGGGSGG